LLAAADGARWSPDPAVRRWAFDVVPNDSAFSALISKWEELGMVDADLTEERAFTFTSDALAAKALRPMTATVQQFGSKPTDESSTDEYHFHLMCNSDHIRGDEGLILNTLLAYRSVLTPTTVYTISCYYLNPAFKNIVPAACVAHPTVLVWTSVWEDCPQGTDRRENLGYNKSYFMAADMMRKFWNAAAGAGFRVDLDPLDQSKTRSITKDEMMLAIRSADKSQLKTVPWGLLHDPVFTLGAFHGVAKS
jgi:hypothetical protein